MRRPKLATTPIPDELANAPSEVIYLWGEYTALRHDIGHRERAVEDRMLKVEEAVRSMATAQGAHASASASGTAEILRRIGQDDDSGSSGLTGKVGGLERAIGTEPDGEGRAGSGLRGDMHKLGQRIEPWDRLRIAFKTLWPLFALIGAGMLALWSPQLKALFGPGVHS